MKLIIGHTCDNRVLWHFCQSPTVSQYPRSTAILNVVHHVSESGAEGRSRLTSTASDLDAADTSHVLLARLTAAERRVAHLSSLLGESETENARLVQLAEVISIPNRLINEKVFFTTWWGQCRTSQTDTCMRRITEYKDDQTAGYKSQIELSYNFNNLCITFLLKNKPRSAPYQWVSLKRIFVKRVKPTRPKNVSRMVAPFVYLISL